MPARKLLLCSRQPQIPFRHLKRGRLDIYVDYGERFSLMTLITGIALHEKQRRARAAVAGADGGGGGGA